MDLGRGCLFLRGGVIFRAVPRDSRNHLAADLRWCTNTQRSPKRQRGMPPTLASASGSLHPIPRSLHVPVDAGSTLAGASVSLLADRLKNAGDRLHQDQGKEEIP